MMNSNSDLNSQNIIHFAFGTPGPLLRGQHRIMRPPSRPESVAMLAETLKRDYARLAHRPDSQTVMAQLQKWFDDYNSYHPHSALGYLPLKLFRANRAVN